MFWPKQFPACVSLWLLLLCLLQRKYDTTTTRALLEINFKCIPKVRDFVCPRPVWRQTNKNYSQTAATWSGPKPTLDSTVLRPGAGQSRVRPGHQSAFSVSSYCRSLCQGRPSTSLLRVRSSHCALFVRSSTRARLSDPRIISYYTILFIVRLFSIIHRVEWQCRVHS